MYHNLRYLGFTRLFKTNEIHNIYSHYWDKMLLINMLKKNNIIRMYVSLNFEQGGCTGGVQGIQFFPWVAMLGETGKDRGAQLPIMVGMSMSGIPYIHANAERRFCRWR